MGYFYDSEYLDYIPLDGRILDQLQIIWKQAFLVWDIILTFPCKGWGKPQNITVMAAGILAEIWTKHLPNTSLGYYHHENLSIWVWLSNNRSYVYRFLILSTDWHIISFKPLNKMQHDALDCSFRFIWVHRWSHNLFYPPFSIFCLFFPLFLSSSIN